MSSSKGLVRQEGFHPDSSQNGHSMDTIDSMDGGASEMDFDQELASLMSSERSTVSSNGDATNTEYVPRTHNIFDMGAPAHHQPLHPSHHTQSPSSSSQNQNTSHSPAPSSIPAHFNSTLPALNSSMRYEPLPDPSTDGVRPGSVGAGRPGSAWRNQSPAPAPSPASATGAGGAHPYASASRVRSRSRSRPPTNNNTFSVSSGNPASPSIGPQRTTRTTTRIRGNSVSSLNSMSTSPPPLHPPTAQAIVIPRNHHSHHDSVGSAGGGSWFGPGSQGSSVGGEYALPTPESLHHGQSPHGSFAQHTQHGFANLSLNVNVSNLNSMASPLGIGSPLGYGGQHGLGSGLGVGVPSQWPSSPGPG